MIDRTRVAAPLSPDLLADLDSLAPHAPVGRRGFVLGSLTAGFAAAVAPTGDLLAQTITTPTEGLAAGEVKIPVADGSVPAYRAMPAGKTRLPTVLVVQEIYGVHEHIQDVCRRFAHAGYLAIAPELYARQGDPTKYASVPEIFKNVVSKVPDEQVLADLDAAARWASTNGGDPDRLGITGFCWGGRIVWLYAAHNPGLKAGVAWYGRLTGDTSPLTPRHPHDVAARLHAPVLGLYGGEDTGIPLTTVDEMKNRLAAGTAAAKASQFILYRDAPHAFHADYRPSYRREAAEDGWRNALAWFRRHGVA
jgi:carboxymethylenebutenolidase